VAYAPHTLVQFGGPNTSLGVADEIWQCNIRGIAPGGGPIADEDTYLGEIHDALKTWFQSIGASMCNESSLEYVKVNAINAAGHYAEAGQTHEYLYAPAAAGNADVKVPSFLSNCIVFRTIVARGPGSHGRIYPPNYSIPVALGSSISAPDQNNVRDSGQALIALLKNTGGTQHLSPSVVSKTGGVVQPITRVGCSNLYDYQSRRKNQGAIGYSFSDVPAD
jgi:hypothetical protein